MFLLPRALYIGAGGSGIYGGEQAGRAGEYGEYLYWVCGERGGGAGVLERESDVGLKNLILGAIPIFLRHLIEYSTFGFGDFAEAFDNFIQIDSIDIEFVC